MAVVATKDVDYEMVMAKLKDAWRNAVELAFRHDVDDHIVSERCGVMLLMHVEPSPTHSHCTSGLCTYKSEQMLLNEFVEQHTKV
jgi:hypothetical protein